MTSPTAESVNPSSFSFDSNTVAETYQRILVPTFFRPWADVTLSYAGLTEHDRMLDLAAGPGTVAFRAAARIPAAQIVAADLAAQMIDLGMTSSNPAAHQIRWVVSRAEDLPFDEGEFDVVVCQQGIQFFENQQMAVAEARRVLRTGGRFAAAVWAPIVENPVYFALQQALASAGRPDLAERIEKPFSFGVSDKLADLLTRSGFQNPVSHTISLPVTYPGGVRQVYESYFALPIGSDISAAGHLFEARLEETLAVSLAPWIHGDQVVSYMSSHLIRAAA